MAKQICPLAIALFSSLLLEALEERPWFDNVYESSFEAGYSFSRFTKVAGAVEQPHHPFNDQLLFFDLGFTPTEQIDLQAEAEFDKTPINNWGFRSTALQGRYRILDDISGDFVSLVVGADVRFVSNHRLRDVSCPYAARLDFELSAAVGKEWGEGRFWNSRAYAFTALGQGTNGLPWVLANAAYEHNWDNRHRLALFVDTDWGLGRKEHVRLADFHGWGPYRHQSIDLGIGYRYRFDVWGELRFSYAYRIYASVFPERVNFFVLSYYLPFSFF